MLYRIFIWAGRAFVLNMLIELAPQVALYYLGASRVVSQGAIAIGFVITGLSGLLTMILGIGVSPEWGDARAKRQFAGAVIVDLVRPKRQPG